MTRNSKNARFMCSSGLVLIVLGAQTAMGGAAFAQSTAVPTDTVSVEQVVVTGSRLTTGFTTPTPVQVLGAAAIQSQAVGSLGELFNRTPAFQVSGPERGGTGTIGPGLTPPNLRNLGATRTLQLVNGVRSIPTDISGTSDTNLIPTSMVERVEVSTGGASAAYGSDAIAGVVNIVLKRHMRGIIGNVQGGMAQLNDDQKVQAAIAGGYDFAGGKGNIMIGGQYEKTGGVDRADRKFPNTYKNMLTNTAWTADGTNGPRNIYAMNTVPAFTTGGTVITAGPIQGMSFNADGTTYFLNKGLNWTPTGSMQLQPGNTQNLGYDSQRFGPVSTPNKRYGILAQIGYDFSDNLRWFAEGEYGHFETMSGSNANATTGIMILADNPYAPAALKNAILANAATLPKDALGRPYVTMAKDMSTFGGPSFAGNGHPLTANNSEWTEKYTTGLEGKIGKYKWDLTYVGGMSLYHTERDANYSPANFYAAVYAVKDAAGNIVCGPIATNPMLPYVGKPGPEVIDPVTGNVISGGGLASGIGSTTLPRQLNTIQPNCVPLNPFGQNTFSIASRDYANVGLDQLNNLMRRNLVSANFSGELIDLPAGAVSFATGVEARQDSLRINILGNAKSGMSFEQLNKNNVMWVVNQTPARGSSTTKEAYVEVGVPVLKDLPFFQSLDLNGAYRITNYSTTGNSPTWKLGGTWDVNSWLRFRGVWSQDIRSPGLNELYVLPYTGFFNGATNKITGVSQSISGQSLNNPALKPEQAKTQSYGLVFQPKWSGLTGLRVAADYYKILVADYIAGYPGSYQGMLDSYFLPCNSVKYATGAQGCEGKSAVDGTPIAQYIVKDASPLGIAQVQTPLVNLSQRLVEGYDFELAYPMPRNLLDAVGIPGTLMTQANVQWMVTLEEKVPNSAGKLVPTTAANLAGIGYSPIRMNAGLEYRQGPFSLGVNMNYWSSFRIDAVRMGPGDPGYTPTSSNSVNINRAVAEALFSLNTSYSLVDTDSRKLQVYGAINNLLNRQPSDVITSGLTDGIGRSFRAGIRFQY